MLHYNTTTASKIVNFCSVLKKKFTTAEVWLKPVEGYDTGINIYNCITRNNVPLILRNKSYATWYTCGPTVYDSSHIGHASCYVKLDIIQRILRAYFNINLITAMNITDIDDKIIKSSIVSGRKFNDIAQTYETEFWNDLKALNVEMPNIRVRVTENIPLIISFIKNIMKKEKAYIGIDKSVYFRVDESTRYGKLQNIKLDSQSHDFKNSAVDFALWKNKKDGEPFWSAPWGDGRPGWHIECSALASRIFGSNLDFHAGGLDLKFPHHENEEVQSCTFHDSYQWVNYWIHTGHLNLKGQDEKMSKSLKNTISINELLAKNTSDDFRMACLLSNYRTSMEFSDEMMKTAKNTLSKFISFNSDCQAYLNGKKVNGNINSEICIQKLKEIEKLIDIALKDDFNTAKCISHLLELTGTISKMMNTSSNSKKFDLIDDSDYYFASDMASIAAPLKFSEKILRIFGFEAFDNKIHSSNRNSINIENVIEEIVQIRGKIRQNAIKTKNSDLFKICDDIRSNLLKNGIEIKDYNNESSWNYYK